MRRMLPGLLLMASCGGPESNLQSSEPYERYLGAKALAEGRDFEKLVPLLEDRHYFVVLGALEALAEIGEPHSLQHVAPRLKHEHPLVRQQACITIRALRGEEGLPVLAEALKDPDPGVRREAVKALSAFGKREDVVAALLEAVGDRDPSVALMAHEKLGDLTGLRVGERSREAWGRALKPP